MEKIILSDIPGCPLGNTVTTCQWSLLYHHGRCDHLVDDASAAAVVVGAVDVVGDVDVVGAVAAADDDCEVSAVADCDASHVDDADGGVEVHLIDPG